MIVRFMIENTGLHDRKTGAKKSNYKIKYFRHWENKFENSKCQLVAIPYNRSQIQFRILEDNWTNRTF